MKVKQIMNTNVRYCSTTEPVFAAAQIMRDDNVGFIPVCDNESRRVTGTITDRDLVVRVLAERLSGDTPCKRVMTKNVITVRQDDSLEHALALMRQHRIARMVVVDGNDSLIGVFSLSDVVQQLNDNVATETLREVVADHEPTLH